MRRLLPLLLLTIGLTGCWADHLNDPMAPDRAVMSPDGGRDAALPDAAPLDAALPADPSCQPPEFLGCAFSRWSWFWDGEDCSPSFECFDLGFRSRESCLAAHRHCGAEPDCAPMDVTVGLDCADDTTRAFWDGTRCRVMDRCQCEGDCREGLLFETMEACTAEYAACL